MDYMTGKMLRGTIMFGTVLVMGVTLMQVVRPMIKQLSGGVQALSEEPPAPAAPAPSPAAPSDPFPWGAVGWGALAVAVVAIALLVAVAAVRSGKRSLEERAARDKQWAGAVAQWDQLRSEYTAAETDPHTLLDRPLILDVSETYTATFHQRYGRLLAMDTSTVPPTMAEVEEFDAEVASAVTAFAAADRNARDKSARNIVAGNRVLAPGEVRKLEKARLLLEQALDPSATASEAQTAYELMNTLMRGLLVIPKGMELSIRQAIENRPILALSSGK